MRRVLAFAAAAVMFGGLAAPASAASAPGPAPMPTCLPGAGPCTETDHFSQLTFLGWPLNCQGYFGSWVLIDVTGIGVQHITVNKAQDFWFTTTFEGAVTAKGVLVTITPNPTGPPTFTISPDPSRPPLTGHFQTWIGFEGNQKNFVAHDTGNLHLTAPDGTAYAVHFNDHASSTAANPFVPHTLVMNTHCEP